MLALVWLCAVGTVVCPTAALIALVILSGVEVCGGELVEVLVTGWCSLHSRGEECSTACVSDARLS